MAYELGNILHENHILVAPTPSVLAEKCLALEAFFAPFRYLDGRLLRLTPSQRPLGSPSILFKNISFFFFILAAQLRP